MALLIARILSALALTLALSACKEPAPAQASSAPAQNQNPFEGHWRVEVNSPDPIPDWKRSYCDDSSGAWLCDFETNAPAACGVEQPVGVEFWIEGDQIKIGGLSPMALAYSDEGVSPGAGEVWWGLAYLNDNDLVVTYSEGCNLKFNRVEN